uniref:Uncharacterized protein n=1 Tax=Strongyloides papillosus TaxID=174720 RepID=A0A0N5B783_STREA
MYNTGGTTECVQIAEGDIQDGESRDESYVGIPGPATQESPPIVPPRLHGGDVRRKMSQFRITPREMTIPQLENALKKKIVEMMGRKIPATLVDKKHVQCGDCPAIIALMEKFDMSNLKSHFISCHSREHICSGKCSGLKGNTLAAQQAGAPKALSCLISKLSIQTFMLTRNYSQCNNNNLILI